MLWSDLLPSDRAVTRARIRQQANFRPSTIDLPEIRGLFCVPVHTNTEQVH